MRIRELRQARGLTGAALARSCGVTGATAYNWEIGKIRPSADKLLLIAAVLECEVGDLFDLAEQQRASEEAAARIRAKAVADAKKLCEEGEECREST